MGSMVRCVGRLMAGMVNQRGLPAGGGEIFGLHSFVETAQSQLVLRSIIIAWSDRSTALRPRIILPELRYWHPGVLEVTENSI